MLSTDTVVQTKDTEEQTNIASTIEDEFTPLPDDELLKEEVKHELKEAILNLNHNEQIVISLFYIEELTLTEIGEVLHLTTSRISQIHKKAIFKLKGLLQKLKLTKFILYHCFVLRKCLNESIKIANRLGEGKGQY